MLKDIVRRLFGHSAPDWRYALLTVRWPLSLEAIKQIAPFWKFHEFVSLAKNPAAQAALREKFGWDGAMLAKAAELADLHFFKHFPVVAFLTDAQSVEALAKLPCVECAHSLPVDSGFDYFNILRGLHWIIEPEQEAKTPVSVVNMSLQTLGPCPFNEKEPMNVATRVLSERGIVVVVAAGNYGPDENTLSPWSAAPWVIGVGAATQDGAGLWEGSSRGVPGHPLLHPSVVAPGVDIVGARSPEGKFQAIDSEGLYAVATGTSFAAPAVSGIAALCLEFLGRLRGSGGMEAWRRQAKEQFGLETLPDSSTPLIVKRMLEDMARPVPGCKEHEAGKGFVDANAAQSYLDGFRLSNFIKVFGVERGGLQDAVPHC